MGIKSEDVPSKLLLSFFLYHQNPLVDHLIRKSPGFQPILYKFIVWTFLGLSPCICYARSLNVDPTIGAVCGDPSVLASLTLNLSKRCSEILIIGRANHYGRGACSAEDCSMGNNIR